MNKIILFLLTINLFAYEDITISSKNVNSVYDGDTFKVNIPNYPQLVGKNIPIRINGIDTPEIRSRCKKEKKLAIQAKHILVKYLKNAKNIKLSNIQRGKYFRIVADVYVDNIDIGKVLINNKLAVSYYGKTKTKDWCK
jgi:endonuclease YncB( thermonuclease family)